MATAPSAWKWSGDIRLCEEARNRTGTGRDINRQRIRFRYGFDAKIGNALKVGSRLVTRATSDSVATENLLPQIFSSVSRGLFGSQ